jgi:ABC-2 type transport system ATP-binding protein
MIKTIDLSKRYEDGVLALDRLNLTVNPGEIYCLLGANGAGKTTTINLLLGFIEPTAGKALINGIDVQSDPLEAKKHIAYLSENVMLYGNFTARQNLDFFTRLGGRPALPREEYWKILMDVGLPKKACEQRVKDFSKGMRQKLGIAIAIAKDAPVLLLDEPMSGLDPKAAAELVATLQRLRSAGKAILMSTHDIFRAKELADGLGIMKDGRKVAELSRANLQSLNLEALYLDYMNEHGEAASAEMEPVAHIAS